MEVYTFCNYARCQDETPESVIADNRLRYDIVMRIRSLDEIDLNFPEEWQPKRIILSYSDIHTKDVIEKNIELNDPRITWVEILNPEEQDSIELSYCKSQFICYCKNEKLSEILKNIDNFVNLDLKKLVLYIDGTNFAYMKTFGIWSMNQGLVPNLENFKLLTNSNTRFEK